MAKHIDPARAALAAAISEASAAERIAGAARSAVTRAGAMVEEASARLEAATAAMGTARAAQGARMASAAISGATLAPGTEVRDARAREQDLTDDLEAARAARGAVEAALAEPEHAERQAKQRVAAAAKVVMATAIEPAVAEVVRLKAELNVALGCLYFLHSSCFTWPPTPESDRVKRHLNMPELHIGPDNPAVGPWRDALAALQRDAEAPLPTN